jgi:P27 family predicted phage terminase small subunit
VKRARGGGRKPLPTYLKLIKGTARKSRLNPKEAQAKPAKAPPKVPAFLLKEARKAWRARCGDLYAAGLITKLDRSAFAAYAQAFGRWEKAERMLAELERIEPASGGLTIITTAGNLMMHPLLIIARQAQADMMRYAAEIGLTPSARSRINATPEEIDPNDKYFA